MGLRTTRLGPASFRLQGRTSRTPTAAATATVSVTTGPNVGIGCVIQANRKPFSASFESHGRWSYAEAEHRLIGAGTQSSRPCERETSSLWWDARPSVTPWTA